MREELSLLSQQKDNQTWDVINPATGEPLAEFRETPINQIPQYYEQAKSAFESWKKTTVKERLQFLKKLRFIMVDELEQIAKVISNDTGKVLVEALTADIITVLDDILFLEKHTEEILKTKKVPNSLLLFGKKSYVEYKARGVVLVISPWNYPFQLAMIPALSALMAGNSVIIKPSEVTPLVGLLMEELFKKAGFPPHVIQVIHGGKDVGAATVDQKPDYIFFTGSVPTGKIIQVNAAKHLIPTTLELGGKDPMIVFADAPIDRAIKGALWGAFTNAGQVCMSVERLYVERSIYPEFVRKLREEVQRLKLGAEQHHDIGAMTFKQQVAIVREHVEDALNHGAQLLTGVHPANWEENSMLLNPMILTDVKQEAKIMNLESFGPILPITPFDHEEEAIQLANQSVYGLNASIWTKDVNKGKRIASQLITGNVVINDVIVSVANPYLPFGGAKESGIGRYHGEGGLLTFCHQTSVMVDPGRKKTEVQWYPYQGKYSLFIELTRGYFGKRKDWLKVAKSFLGLMNDKQ